VLRSWNIALRNELRVGDTLQFEADVRLAALGYLFAAYSSYVAEAAKPGTPFLLQGKELTDAKNVARMMQGWMTGSWPVTCAPFGVAEPEVVARLEEEYFVAGLDRAVGSFTVIGQVDALLAGEERLSIIRIMTGSPPTKAELDLVPVALEHFRDPAKELMGIDLTDADFVHRTPTVVIKPLAIFR
jgi:hypothetical protein